MSDKNLSRINKIYLTLQIVKWLNDNIENTKHNYVKPTGIKLIVTSSFIVYSEFVCFYERCYVLFVTFPRDGNIYSTVLRPGSSDILWFSRSCQNFVIRCCQVLCDGNSWLFEFPSNFQDKLTSSIRRKFHNDGAVMRFFVRIWMRRGGARTCWRVRCRWILRLWPLVISLFKGAWLIRCSYVSRSMASIDVIDVDIDAEFFFRNSEHNIIGFFAFSFRDANWLEKVWNWPGKPIV